MLAREVINTESHPSLASGVEPIENLQDSDDTALDSESNYPHVTWLLDIERSARVTHWSGNDRHPQHRTLAGATINAFQHCSYLASDKQLVFADLQCRCFAPYVASIDCVIASASWGGTSSAPVLFDVMTHTIDG